MKIVAVIPCYNEEKYIGLVVTEARYHLDTVIVSDDNSIDRTINEAEKFGALIVRSDSKGKGAGATTRRGVNRALQLGADYVITLDGDGQHIPTEVVRFVGAINSEYDRADLIIGCRFLRAYKIHRMRKLGIDVVTWVFNLGHKRNVVDSQSGYRAYSRRLIEQNIFTSNSYGFSIESLAKAYAGGFTITEVPISCVYHDEFSDNSTMTPIKQGIIVLWAIIKWRLKCEVINKIFNKEKTKRK